MKLTGFAATAKLPEPVMKRLDCDSPRGLSGRSAVRMPILPGADACLAVAPRRWGPLRPSVRVQSTPDLLPVSGGDS